MRNVEVGVCKLWLVRIAVSIVVLPVRCCYRRRTVVDGLRLAVGVACHKVETEVEALLCLNGEVVAVTLGNVVENVDG